MRVEITNAEYADLKHVSNNMRELDKREVREIGGLTPADAVFHSALISRDVRAARIDGVAVAVFGESRTNGGDTSVLWLLGTDDLMRGRFAYIREANKYIAQIRGEGCRIENVVHEDNEPSIRLLEALGFEFGEAEDTAHGGRGVRFWMESSDV